MFIHYTLCVNRFINLATHMGTLRGEKLDKCEKCHLGFSCSRHFASHIRTQRGERMWSVPHMRHMKDMVYLV